MTRQMRCPWCKHVFQITQEQMNTKHTFRCPKCKRHNHGSIMADENGILIGTTKEDLNAISRQLAS